MRELFVEKLQCNLAAKTQIFGEIDNPHSATDEQRFHPIVINSVARIHCGFVGQRVGIINCARLGSIGPTAA